MRAIVPYASRAIVPRASPNFAYSNLIQRAFANYLARNRRVRMAYGAAKYVYQNRRSIKRAVGTFRRGVKKARRQRRVAGIARRSQSNQVSYDSFGVPLDIPGVITVARKTVWSAAIETVKPKSATTELLGQASSNSFRLVGLKVCLNATNIAASVGSNSENRYVVHFAILQPKQFLTSSDRTITIDTNDFFVNPGGAQTGTDRYLSFINGTADATVDQRYNCNGINKEKWNIITHAKKVLTAEGAQKGQSFWKYEKYFDMGKKKFEYEQVGDVIVTKPLYAVYWYERHNADVTTLATHCPFTILTRGYYKNT